MRVLILRYVCPHTTINMCPHTAMHLQASSSRASCPETSASYYNVSSYYHMCPHTTIYVSSYYYICVRILLYGVFILLHVSSYYHICVLTLLYICPQTTMCPHTTTCVLILLSMCPHTTTHVQASSSRASSRKTTPTPCNRARLSREPSTEQSPPWYTLPHLCPHTTTYVSAYSYMCRHTNRAESSQVCTTTYVSASTTYMCPHTTISVSSY